MKTDKNRDILKNDDDRRFLITLDTINLFLALAVIIISLIALGADESPKIMKKLIFGAMAVISALNVARFYHERPGISAICLLVAAALATLCVMI